MTAPIGALSMGNISTPALPSLTPSSGTQLAQAIGQAPQLIQQQQLQAATSQDQIQGFAEKRLQQLAALGASSPGMSDNPQWVNQVEQTFRALGRPVPKDDQGKINIQAMLPPLPPDIALKGLGLPPGIGRKAVYAGYSYDPEILNAPMQTALNAGAYTGAQRMAQAALFEFQSGKSTPDGYQAAIKALAPTLGDSIASYLDPSVIQAGISSWADSQIQKLHDAGVHMKNEDQYRQQFLQQGMDKFNRSFDERQRMDNARIPLMQAQTARANQATILASKTQSAHIDLLNNQVEHLRQINKLGALGGKLPAAATQFLTQYRSIQSQYDANLRAIGQQGVISASKPIAPGQPSLVDATADLKTKLDALEPTYTDLQNSINNAAAGTARAVTGMPVVPVGKTISREKVIRVGKEKGWNTNEALRQAKLHGYTVTP